MILHEGVVELESDDAVRRLAGLRIESERHRSFFGQHNREEREKWVVRTFLQKLDIAFDEGDLEAHSENDDVDVSVRKFELAFQIKEILSPTDRRGDEVDDYIAVVAAEGEKARTRAEQRWLRDLPGIADGADLVTQLALDESRRYNRASKLDLLIYVTRQQTSLVKLTTDHRRRLGEAGWRSVSVLCSRAGLVLFASADAAGILRDAFDTDVANSE
ncbi:MAG: DUF1780 domain-containing protein [Micropepsaceae bacterium]